MTALSGIEQALYDIAGKHFGVPSYWLLGGPTRDRIKVYAHCRLDDFERMDWLIKEKGYKAFKSGPGGKWHGQETPQRIKEFAETTEVNYPILLGETDAIELSRLLGNRFNGLPFTAIFDRMGKLIYVQAGELSQDTLQERAIPLL